jgi:hypothetical protein
MTDPAAPDGNPHSPWRLIVADLALLVALAGVSVPLLAEDAGSSSAGDSHVGTAAPRRDATTTTTVPGPTTTTTVPAPTTTTEGTLPPPGPGFVPGRVTAVGDSVMIDYQRPLEADVPGVFVNASVSRQWSGGQTILGFLKVGGALGAEVIVGLGTNGPITDADFQSMMSVLSGASRVVFVNTHVDRPWQDANNAVLATGASRYPNVVVADWATLAAQHPEWFGTDGTHLAVDGSGATALAALVASKLAPG